jgi:hypothetical protein
MRWDIARTAFVEDVQRVSPNITRAALTAAAWANRLCVTSSEEIVVPLSGEMAMRIDGPKPADAP